MRIKRDQADMRFIKHNNRVFEHVTQPQKEGPIVLFELSLRSRLILPTATWLMCWQQKTVPES